MAETQVCSRRRGGAPRLRISWWTEAGWWRFRNAAAEASPTVFMTRASVPIGRRAIRAIQSCRFPGPIERSPISRLPSMCSASAPMSPHDQFSWAEYPGAACCRLLMPANTVAKYLGALEAGAPQAAVRPQAEISTPQVLPAAGAGVLVDDVPIPGGASVRAVPGVPKNLARFSGAWIGIWGDRLRHILIVEDVSANGNASVVYAYGDNPAAKVGRGWDRLNATISGDTLRIEGSDAYRFVATYRFIGFEKLIADYQSPNGRGRATMSKIELADLTRPGVKINWSGRNPAQTSTAKH
jgi:hypothetical protein